MNRVQFLAAALPFLDWAGSFSCDEHGHLTPVRAGALATLPVTLSIPASSKVREPVEGTHPVHRLTRVYSWRSAGMVTGDFAETRAVVAGLARGITEARTRQAAIEACEAILQWGGDRNSKVGATPFLHTRPDLVGYLASVKRALTLETAAISEAGSLGAVLGMNAMLTKVHAFNSSDGLPIYDSRVAGAMATVVETWRRDTGRVELPLPEALTFPEVGGGGRRRSVVARYEGCKRPGSLYYATKAHDEAHVLAQARGWASAKVRLGWLLSELLEQPTPSGMRSLEACLFMAGYDCAGINV